MEVLLFIARNLLKRRLPSIFAAVFAQCGFRYCSRKLAPLKQQICRNQRLHSLIRYYEPKSMIVFQQSSGQAVSAMAELMDCFIVPSVVCALYYFHIFYLFYITCISIQNVVKFTFESRCMRFMMPEKGVICKRLKCTRICPCFCWSKRKFHFFIVFLVFLPLPLPFPYPLNISLFGLVITQECMLNFPMCERSVH